MKYVTSIVRWEAGKCDTRRGEGVAEDILEVDDAEDILEVDDNRNKQDAGPAQFTPHSSGTGASVSDSQDYCHR